MDLSTVAGTARLSDSDYSNPSTPTVSFNATGDNQTPSVTVPINDDSVVEDNETFTVRLTNLTGVSASLVDTSDNATVTITDNDGQATVTINDNNTVENGGSLTFTLSLDKATNDNFTVSYTTVDLSAVGGSDYTSKTDNVSFSGSAGETQTVTISLLGDAVVEDNETFRVVLNQVAGMSSSLMDISDNATGQIDNDDGGASVTIDNLTVTETDGDQTVTVTLRLDKETSSGFTVGVGTQAATATAGSDYVASLSPTSVSFAGSPAGETESVTLTIKGDTDPEIVEQFWLEMTSLSGMSSSLVDISDNASVTITDNDQAVLTIDDVVVNEGDNATVTLRLNKAVGADFKVNLTTSDGTATAGSDYTITNTQVTFN
ncbi:MAG: Calx-beta domain-containing protein, partial [Actinomycetota bacterium]|nr:Calx-beta domain-containing protein [Actinomycetota bacterium]